jgi:hypothetical protein
MKHKQARITTGSGRPCQARTVQGGRCNAWAIAGSDFCFAHDAGSAKNRSAARLKGGLNHRTLARVSGDTPIVIKSMADVLALVNAVLSDSWQLENSPARSRCLLACASVAIEALTLTDFETRITALESGVKHGKH